MFYNIHTHSHSQQENVVCIHNLHQDFDAIPATGYASMGLHPWYLKDDKLETQLEELRRNITRPDVLAVGECGLDKLTGTPWDLQLTAFREQVALAEQVKKPLVIHCVKAFGEVLSLVKHVQVPVVFHGINNKLTVIQPVIDAGHYLSFGTVLLGERPFIAQVLAATPLEKVFLETDDSGTDIREIYKSAARIKNITEKEIVLQLERNFLNVFRP